MTTNKIPSASELWQRHEELILGVFILALKILRLETNLPDAENRINETLCVKARLAYHKLPSRQRPSFFGLFMEPQNQPQTKDDVGEKFLLKKPDFKWRLENKSDPNPATAIRDYDIECKRLGRPLRKSRVLNEEYVKKGILRFLNIEHSYGRGMKFGAMIGYVQNMEFDTITNEVNQYIKQIKEHKIPSIKFQANGFSQEKTVIATQQLERTEVLPSKFNLRHVWVDLRN